MACCLSPETLAFWDNAIDHASRSLRGRANSRIVILMINKASRTLPDSLEVMFDSLVTLGVQTSIRGRWLCTTD